MRQPALFDELAEMTDEQYKYLLQRMCDRGQHGPLTNEPPVLHPDYVNVSRRCSVCGREVRIVSWTREAWDEKHPNDPA